MRPHNATLILSTRDLYAKLRNAHWKAGPTASEPTAFDPDNLDIPEKYDDCRWMHNFYSWEGSISPHIRQYCYMPLRVLLEGYFSFSPS